MKPTDKITVEITLAELAKIYAVMGFATGASSELFALGSELFEDKADHKLLSVLEEKLVDTIPYGKIQEQWIYSIFKEEEKNPIIEEVKQVIVKAQQLIAELEKLQEKP